MENSEKTVVIVGGSTGIGLALVNHYLGLNHKVLLIGRALPLLDKKYSKLHFFKVDFEEQYEDRSRDFIDFIISRDINSVDYLFLNSGVFCDRMRNMSSTPLDELNKIMNINVFGHKWVLDLLIENRIAIKHCIASSSIAGVRARAGNGSYAITKSTLNMLMKIYALEHKNIFFSVLGLCVVDTYLGQNIGKMPMEVVFEEQVKLRERVADPKYWVSPAMRVRHLAMLLEKGPDKYLTSGEFREIREILKEESFHAELAPC